MSGRVIVLLSTYNGAAFLPEQLASFQAQTHADWALLWRDDGSTDATVTVMEAFAARTGRCGRLEAPAGNLGVLRSYLTLLREAVPRLGPADAVAFSDQDDVWLPEKLARGMAALAEVPAEVPALLCTRQRLVDDRLAPLGESPKLRRPPGFPASLAQNIATGCTILLNRAAAALIARSAAPEGTLHDWWSYLLVTAAGGRVLVDAEPQVLYRQHGRNTVGAPRSTLARASGAIRRGPEAFMRLFRAHLAALAAQPDLLAPDARAAVARLLHALEGGRLRRLAALGMPGLVRQTALETLTFRLWFLLG
ncbi:MAG TPA: glycosyltransferase [Acetobacteraceae bacterium]|nr:glycosyltransferase [Acetobacteraceae bacterium]